MSATAAGSRMGTMTKTRSDIGHTIEQLKTELKAHPLYRSIGTADDLRFFMSHHVKQDHFVLAMPEVP